MAEAIALAQKLGGVGFPTLLVLILIGSYFEIWVWGRQLAEMRASRDDWKAVAYQSAGITEDLVVLSKRKTAPRDVP